MRIVLFTALAILIAPVVAEQKPVLTAHPEFLLNAMPKGKPGWKAKVSRGEFSVGSWFMTTARRRFEGPLLGEDANAQPPFVDLEVVDGGFHPETLGDFLDFKPDESADGTLRRILDGGRPTVLSKRGEDFELSILHDKRFVLRVRVNQGGEDLAREWMKMFDLAALSSAKKKKVKSFPQSVPTILVDQLNPQKSQNIASTTSDGSIADLYKELDELGLLDEAEEAQE